MTPYMQVAMVKTVRQLYVLGLDPTARCMETGDGEIAQSFALFGPCIERFS